jgi:hypothetical protein
MKASDDVFVKACRDAGLDVGVQSGLLILAVRKVFEEGVRHTAWRHMARLWAVHEELNEAVTLHGSMDSSAVQDMLAVRKHIELIRKEYLQ